VIGDLFLGDYSTPLGTVLAQTLGNTVAVVIGALLLRRLTAGRGGLDRVPDVLAFVACAGIAAAAEMWDTQMTRLEDKGAQLERTMRVKDDFIALVSHELRTPLTSIIGFAQTLRERGADLDEATRAEMVRNLVEQAIRLQLLLSDLLDLDRMRHGLLPPSFRPTDVGALVANVAARQAEQGRQIGVHAEPVVADVDAAKVERIVENLLANAVKHTPPGTDVIARVERGHGFVMIAVDDRGLGVQEEEREAVFELFTRGYSHDGVPGAGIGLSLVAQFAAVHGGRAWIEDHPGGGASFRVRLPLHQEAGQATAAG